jgi:amino acid transporter
MLIFGGLGTVSNWIIAPTKGLLVAGQDGHLPQRLTVENKNGAPVTLLFGQAIIVTVLTLTFLFMPSVNSSYWLLTALTAQLYMMMYILMFATGIYLSFTDPDQPRGFRIPGGKVGMVVVAGREIIGTGTTFFVSFIPPSTIYTGSVWLYEAFLLSGLILMCLPPFIIMRWQQRRSLVTAS